MSQAYCAAGKAVGGEPGHVIDRVHVVQQAVAALDAVWRAVPRPRAPAAAQALKKRRKRWLQSADQRQVAAWIAR